MQKSQESVIDFMRLYGQELPERPTIPDEETRMMRVHSLAEEVGEFAIASGVTVLLLTSPDRPKPEVEVTAVKGAVADLEQVADALVDIQYFVDGTANAYGFDLMPLFEEVHRANMNKLWTKDELGNMQPGWAATMVLVTPKDDGYALPPDKQDMDAPVPVVTRYIVKRTDGKVMKPPGFNPPNLSGVLEDQKRRHELDTAISSPSSPDDPTRL